MPQGYKGLLGVEKTLTKKYLDRRLKWSKEHLIWHADKIIFNGEYKRVLHSNPSEYVRRQVEERNNTRWTTKMVKFGVTV